MKLVYAKLKQNASRLTNALLLAFAALLLFGVAATVNSVRVSLEVERNNVVSKAALLVEHIDYELDFLIHGVRTMQIIADRYLAGRVQATENPVSHLKAVPEQQAYISELPETLDAVVPASKRGRITGLLPVPAEDDSVSKEMAMAIGMSPVMESMRAHMPDIPWIYYTSERRFMYLFPESEASDFFFKPALMDMEFIARAGAEANPSRAPIWTQPYQDEAGKGLMVTVSNPVYFGDAFKGVISVDVSVQRLQRLLDMHAIVGANVELVSDDDQQLARRTTGNASLREQDTIVQGLSNAPWRVLVTIDHAKMLELALKDRSAEIGGIAILLISFVFMLLLARSAHRIRELSIRDGLTGLHNRRHFDSVIDVQFEGARRGNYRLVLAILDVDFFKKYNDRYGHQQGDTALKAVAQALRGLLQRGTDQAFRIGGEEFAVVMHLHASEAIDPPLARINQAIRDMKLPHEGNPPGYVTVSIGAVVVDSAHWLSPSDAYKQADAALYQAKGAGRDRFVCATPT